jgi:hypothetical protein
MLTRIVFAGVVQGDNLNRELTRIHANKDSGGGTGRRVLWLRLVF